MVVELVAVEEIILIVVVVVVDMCTCAFETLQQNRWSMLSGSGRLVGVFIHALLRR